MPRISVRILVRHPNPNRATFEMVRLFYSTPTLRSRLSATKLSRRRRARRGHEQGRVQHLQILPRRWRARTGENSLRCTTSRYWCILLLTIALSATFLELISAIAACLSRSVQIDEEEFLSREGRRCSLSPAVFALLSHVGRQDYVAFPRASYRPHALFHFCHGRGQNEALQVFLICPKSKPARLGTTHPFSGARRLLVALTCLGNRFAQKSDARRSPK